MYSFFFSGHWGGCDTDLQSRLSTNQNKQWTYCMQILRMHTHHHPSPHWVAQTINWSNWFPHTCTFVCKQPHYKVDDPPPPFY